MVWDLLMFISQNKSYSKTLEHVVNTTCVTTINDLLAIQL